jgi:hypothetical protein
VAPTPMVGLFTTGRRGGPGNVTGVHPGLPGEMVARPGVGWGVVELEIAGFGVRITR